LLAHRRAILAKMAEKLIPTNFFEDWMKSTERIIGSMIKKKGVKVSDPSRQNIRLHLLNATANYTEIRIYFRDSLRMTDMGAGRGYRKGQRVASIQDLKDNRQLKGRKRKKITNRPIYRRISNLQKIVILRVIEEITDEVKNSFENVHTN
jgi:hypothetical protein